jgi:hypothetical protein
MYHLSYKNPYIADAFTWFNLDRKTLARVVSDIVKAYKDEGYLTIRRAETPEFYLLNYICENEFIVYRRGDYYSTEICRRYKSLGCALKKLDFVTQRR